MSHNGLSRRGYATALRRLCYGKRSAMDWSVKTPPPKSETPAKAKKPLDAVSRRLVRWAAGADDADLDRAGRSTAYALVEGYVSVVLNLALFALKLALGIVTGSVALIADAVHTASDSLTSVVVIVSAYVGRRPPDREHPYGHGRIEYVGAVVIAVLLAVAGLEFGKTSVIRVFEPQTVSASWFVVAVVMATAVVKEWLARYALNLSRRSGNRSLAADAWHHRSDAIATAIVALGMVAASMGWPIVDGIVGVVVSLLLLKVAYDIAREAVDSLLGQAPSPEEVQAVKRNAASVEGVRGVHDVVIHKYGANVFVSLHVETDPEPAAVDLHDLSAEVEKRVADGGHGSVCVHVDPIDRRHPAYERVSSIMSELVANDADMVSFHDLRLCGDPQDMRVALDLVCSPDCKDCPPVCRRVELAICQEFPGARVVVDIEPAYSY